jgi:predicted permease
MRLQHWRFTVPLRLRSIFLRHRVERELEEELLFHLEHRIEEGIAAGLAPGEARRQALLAMGGPELHREEIRATRRVNWLTDFVADLRFAFRSLRRTPSLTAVVVVTLALGIGMTALPFSMVDALIFRPYPVPDPEDMVTLVSTSRDSSYDYFSYREYVDIRDNARSYAGVIANTPARSVAFAADARATPRVKGGILVSGNYFSVLGVEPHLGRGFRPDEDQVPGRDAVVVLGHGFWQRELASDPSVVGRTIRLNGTDFAVVGVAPEWFPGMSIFSRPDFFVPLAMAPRFSTDPQSDFFEDRDDRELRVLARLAPGVELEEARSELAALARSFAREYPAANRDRAARVLTPFQIRTRGDDANWKFSVIFVILGVTVLLVACTNVAGLLLSRAKTRTREIAVRLALGAGRFRLVRLLLAESLILAGLGAVLGIAIGYGAITYMRDFDIPAELPVTIPFRMDARVLLAGLAVGVLSAVLCGLAPALQSTRGDLVSGLKTGAVDPPGRKRLWGRDALVVAQVAMSLMLLAASFLMARSFRNSVVGGIGFPRERLLLVRFDPRLVQYDGARTRQFYELLTDRVREAAGVRSAGLSQNPPLGLGGFDAISFVPGDFQMPPDRERFTVTMDTVDEGFFATMGIPVLSGRGVLASDTAETPRVAVVNDVFAKRYWPDSDAVGKRLWLDRRAGSPVEIVGVVQTVKYRDPTELPTEFVYLPLAQHPQARMILLLRTTGDPLQLVAPMRDIVRALDPNLPMLETRTFEDLYRYHAVEGPGVAVELVGTMGAVGLLLTVAGLYGLVAYNVSRRTREIGIRMAIGAGPATAFRMVLGDGLVLVGIGSVIGLVMGFAVERLMNSTLFNAGGTDVVAYLVVVPSMVLVTLLAAFVPARRAARIPPTLALRLE